MKDRPCPFCDYQNLKNKTWFVAWEPFPVGIGHMKLMPFRHNATLFDLTVKEERDFWELLKRVKDYLDLSMGEHKPDGYNLGVNQGEAVGQTICHLHVHLIPRYKGDIENPRGGIRNIKPPLVKW